jgi:hypothetical protein
MSLARAGAHTEPVPDDASWLERVVVPDDLSELQADVEAYHRERRSAARRRRLGRITGTRAWQRLALPAAVVLGSLAIAGAVLAILTFGHPKRVVSPPAAAIATAPAAAPGQVDGLIPDVSLSLRAPNAEVSARDLRPALVALVPLRCHCTSLLEALASQADEVAVPFVVVAPAGQDAEVDALIGALHRGDVRPAFDPTGELRSTYAATGVTVLGLRADATVSFIGKDVDPTARLELELGQMIRPPASMSAR